MPTYFIVNSAFPLLLCPFLLAIALILPHGFPPFYLNTEHLQHSSCLFVSVATKASRWEFQAHQVQSKDYLVMHRILLKFFFSKAQPYFYPYHRILKHI